MNMYVINNSCVYFFYQYIIIIRMVSFRVVVDRLKSNFLLKKFLKSLQESSFIDDLNDIVNTDYSLFCLEDEIIIKKFDMIREYICKKSVIIEVDNILNNYYRWYKYDSTCMFRLTSKHLLSAWMINYCPTIILGNLDSNEKYYLNVYAEKIIMILTNITKLTNISELTNIVELNKTILHYTDCMMMFLEKDKIDKINHYTAEWISLDKSYDIIANSKKYDLIQKELILHNINKDKELIEKHIKIFMKNFDFDRLKKIIDISKNISKKIIDNYKNIIYNDINQQNYEISYKLLNEIKNFIIMFNRKNDINDINEKFDIDYFIHLLKSNVIGLNDIKQFGDYLIRKICEIGSIKSEEENLIKWNEIKNTYNENNKNYIYLISDMFIFSLELIEIIKNELLDYEFLIKNILS